jgi:hypothetical protein
VVDDAEPPAKPPHYASGGWFRMGSDAPQFAVHQTPDGPKFEFFGGDDGDDPVLAARAYADDIARTAASRGRWTSCSGWRIHTRQPTTFGKAHVVPFTADHPDGRSTHGTLRLQADPSNWVRADVFVEGTPVFTGFFDRVYEEFDIWPPGASGEGEAPARIGKRMNWVGLSIEPWPRLAAIASEGGVIIHEGEEVP